MGPEHGNCALVLCWSLPGRPQCLVPSSLAPRTNLPHSLVWLNLPSEAEWTAVFISWSMADFCNYIWCLSNLPEFLKFPESLWALFCLIIRNTFAHLFSKGFLVIFTTSKGKREQEELGQEETWGQVCEFPQRENTISKVKRDKITENEETLELCWAVLHLKAVFMQQNSDFCPDPPCPIGPLLLNVWEIRQTLTRCSVIIFRSLSPYKTEDS